ncbi:MAG: hypothetical protein PHE77_01550 [Candidatus Pacebacteria bacterium]|nr:hypothetical protein [Candidatus Paceibacterota bacterium]
MSEERKGIVIVESDRMLGGIITAILNAFGFFTMNFSSVDKLYSIIGVVLECNLVIINTYNIQGALEVKEDLHKRSGGKLKFIATCPKGDPMQQNWERYGFIGCFEESLVIDTDVLQDEILPLVA